MDLAREVIEAYKNAIMPLVMDLVRVLKRPLQQRVAPHRSEPLSAKTNQKAQQLLPKPPANRYPAQQILLPNSQTVPFTQQQQQSSHSIPENPLPPNPNPPRPLPPPDSEPKPNPPPPRADPLKPPPPTPTFVMPQEVLELAAHIQQTLTAQHQLLTKLTTCTPGFEDVKTLYAQYDLIYTKGTSLQTKLAGLKLSTLHLRVTSLCTRTDDGRKELRPLVDGGYLKFAWGGLKKLASGNDKAKELARGFVFNTEWNQLLQDLKNHR